MTTPASWLFAIVLFGVLAARSLLARLGQRENVSDLRHVLEAIAVGALLVGAYARSI
jgi:hypothetical protein